VRYANKHGIPFYAVNTGHGSTTSQTRFNGIQIDLSLLTSVRVSPGIETAWIHGGSTVEVTVDELWGQGYVTSMQPYAFLVIILLRYANREDSLSARWLMVAKATGGAGCPGILGVGLGGGHGWLQGFHGLAITLSPSTWSSKMAALLLSLNPLTRICSGR
jgi:FAD/FMN-containing dehydrogenase